MLHRDRIHTIIDVESIEALATLLTSYRWSLTTGFSLEGVLFLNDSTRPDAVQEFAVVRNGKQSESLTVGDVLTRDEVECLLAQIVHRAVDVNPAQLAVAPAPKQRDSSRQ